VRKEINKPARLLIFDKIMKKALFITTVTRMDENFVCVSGLDENGKFVKPEISYPSERPGIKKEFLFSPSGEELIRPMTIVEFEFIRAIPKRLYHSEDWLINGDCRPQVISVPTPSGCANILDGCMDKNLNSALAQKSRSLVTISPPFMPKVEVKIDTGNRLECRLVMKDSEDNWINSLESKFGHPRVTDAYWLALCKHLYKKGQPVIEEHLRNLFKGKKIYMIIGITREWYGKFWRQVSGVLTVPYWLGEKTFADFNYDFTDNV